MGGLREYIQFKQPGGPRIVRSLPIMPRVVEPKCHYQIGNRVQLKVGADIPVKPRTIGEVVGIVSTDVITVRPINLIEVKPFNVLTSEVERVYG